MDQVAQILLPNTLWGLEGSGKRTGAIPSESPVAWINQQPPPCHYHVRST